MNMIMFSIVLAVGALIVASRIIGDRRHLRRLAQPLPPGYQDDTSIEVTVHELDERGRRKHPPRALKAGKAEITFEAGPKSRADAPFNWQNAGETERANIYLRTFTMSWRKRHADRFVCETSSLQNIRGTWRAEVHMRDRSKRDVRFAALGMTPTDAAARVCAALVSHGSAAGTGKRKDGA